MEDVTVTLLDGTKVAKSQVPAGVVYINENGVKVKKVASKAASTAPAASALLGGNLLGGLKDMINQKLPSVMSNFDVAGALKKLQGIPQLKGVNLQSLEGLLKNLKGGKAGNVSGLISDSLGGLNGLDLGEISKAASSLGIPGLDKVLGAVGGMSAKATPMQQLDSYLSLAMEDGVITDEENVKIQKLASAAGIGNDKLQAMIKQKQC
ncbi:MAG: hypothetical protein MJZ52_01050 [Bacteroidales bacterium]|nr:hypothetical protein [Bacteroidales bacterium]